MWVCREDGNSDFSRNRHIKLYVAHEPCKNIKPTKSACSFVDMSVGMLGCSFHCTATNNPVALCNCKFSSRIPVVERRGDGDITARYSTRCSQSAHHSSDQAP